MFSENCVVWIATWVLTPINVVSSPLPSFLLYFLFKHLFWKNIRSRFFTISLHFLKKFLMFYFSLFENVLPLTLTIWQKQKVFFLEGSSFHLFFLGFLRVSFVLKKVKVKKNEFKKKEIKKIKDQTKKGWKKDERKIFMKVKHKTKSKEIQFVKRKGFFFKPFRLTNWISFEKSFCDFLS